MNFTQEIFRRHAKHANKLAIIDASHKLTFQELEHYVLGHAQHLIKQGYKSGDRFVISMDDSAEWIVILLSCIAIGGVPVLISNLLPESKIKEVYNFSNAVKLFRDSDNVIAHYQEHLTNYFQYKDSDPSIWVLTSGSTNNNPKCAVHSHERLLWILDSNPYSINFDDCILSSAKFSWTWGFYVVTSCTLGQGATVVINHGTPAPSKLLKLINNNNVTHLFTVPRVLSSLVKHQNAQTKTSLKFAVSASEPLPVKLELQFYTTYGIHVLDTIGMSETLGIYSTQYISDRKAGTLGKPVAGFVYEIRNNDNTVLPDGKVGEIFIRPQNGLFYYWNDSNATNKALVDGWIKTNDNGFIDKDKNLVYMSRSDDAIKINGLYVRPHIIEEHIALNKKINDCAVISQESETGLPELHAFIVDNGQCTNYEINETLRKNLEPHEIPKYYHRVDHIPRGITGKILKKRLKAY